MKKVILSVLLLACLLLTGCSSTLPWQIEKSKAKVYDCDAVKLSVLENSLTGSGCTYILENNLDHALYSSETYCIEIRKDDMWNHILTEASFPAILSSINSGEKTEHEIDWEQIYGKLPSGKYRLLVSVAAKKDYSEGECFASVEFLIE